MIPRADRARRTRLKKPSKWQLLFAGLFVSLVAIFGILWFGAPRSLDQDARAIIHAVIENDADTIFEHTHEFQRDAAGISKADFRRLWQEVIQPRLAGCKAVVGIDAYVFRGDHQGVGWTTIKHPAGPTFDLSVAPWATNRGGRIDLLHFLVVAWEAEFVHSQLRPLTPVASLEARLAGLEADRQVLESIGIKGWPPTAPAGNVVPWDDTVRYWQERIASLRSE
jgi:hypothetical protein